MQEVSSIKLAAAVWEEKRNREIEKIPNQKKKIPPRTNIKDELNRLDSPKMKIKKASISVPSSSSHSRPKPELRIRPEKRSAIGAVRK